MIAQSGGYVNAIDAELIGKASLLLGAGRETKNSEIDLSAGINLFVKPGDKIAKGDVLCELCNSNPDKMTAAIQLAKNAFTISDDPVSPSPLILETVE